MVRFHSYHPHEVKFFPGGENSQKLKRLFFRGWPFFLFGFLFFINYIRHKLVLKVVFKVSFLPG